MALTCGFFNSLAGDRKYNAEHMSSIFDGIINDGVFSSIGNKLTTIAGSGMQVIVQSGKAWFLHTWTLNDGNYPLPIDGSDPTLKRIDAVVLEVNHNTNVRTNTLKIVKGTSAASPQKPSLTSNDLVKQVALAYVTIPAGATKIETANIEVNVGKDTCPYVTGILQVTSVSSLYSQWNAEFTKDLNSWKSEFQTWFDDIQEKLSDKVVTNLQSQITTNANSIKTLQTDLNTFKNTTAPNTYVKEANKASSSDATTGTNNTKWMTPSTVMSAINSKLNSSGYGKTQIVTYIGTGTYGESSPTTVTFSFTPKIVMVFGAGVLAPINIMEYDNSWMFLPFIIHCYETGSSYINLYYSYVRSSDGFYTSYNTIKLATRCNMHNNTIKIVNNSSSEGQFNKDIEKYHWIAIG